MASRPQCNQIALTFTKESVYGTAVVNGSIDKRYDPQEPIVLGLVKTKVDDAEKIKGHEFASDPDNKDIIIARDITVPFSFDSSVELIGLLAAIFFGADSVSGGGSDFVHTYKTADLCALDQFPSISAILGLSGDTASFLKIKGVLVNELRIVLDGQGFLTVSGSLMSDGSFTTESGYVFPTAETPIDFIIGTQADFLTADGITGVDAAIQEDNSGGPSFIDETTDANDAGVGDVTVPAPMDNNDALYVGRINQFGSIAFLISTPGAGDAVEAESVWEYSQGSDTWASLTGVTDATTALTAAAGERVLSFTIPSDWATDTVNSQGPFYYIRLRATAANIYNTTTPLLTQIGNALTIVSKKTLLRGFELSMTNNLDVADARGNVAAAGANLGSLRAGTREFSLTITVEGHQGDEFWQDMDLDIVRDVQLKVTKNVNRELDINFNSCKIENIVQRFDGIRDVMDLQYKMFYNTIDASPILFIVRNGDAAYLI